MLKKTLTILFIIAVVSPMFFYLNPFVWGLRKPPFYKPSYKTEQLILRLNKKYKLSINVGGNEGADTLWYFIEARSNEFQNLKNFELYKVNLQNELLETKVFKDYADDFIKEFEHKQYFDSIIIASDTLKYKFKIQ